MNTRGRTFSFRGEKSKSLREVDIIEGPFLIISCLSFFLSFSLSFFLLSVLTSKQAYDSLIFLSCILPPFLLHSFFLFIFLSYFFFPFFFRLSFLSVLHSLLNQLPFFLLFYISFFFLSFFFLSFFFLFSFFLSSFLIFFQRRNIYSVFDCFAFLNLPPCKLFY